MNRMRYLFASVLILLSISACAPALDPIHIEQNQSLKFHFVEPAFRVSVLNCTTGQTISASQERIKVKAQDEIKITVESMESEEYPLNKISITVFSEEVIFTNTIVQEYSLTVPDCPSRKYPLLIKYERVIDSDGIVVILNDNTSETTLYLEKE